MVYVHWVFWFVQKVDEQFGIIKTDKNIPNELWFDTIERLIYISGSLQRIYRIVVIKVTVIRDKNREIIS